MKKKINKSEFTDREWEEIASSLSGENVKEGQALDRFLGEDEETADLWRMAGSNSKKPPVDVDAAWTRLSSRISADEKLQPGIATPSIVPFRRRFLKMAATIALLAAIGSVTFFIARTGIPGRMISYSTAAGEKNSDILLPDGSRVYLNRNSTVTFSRSFGKNKREVTLKGEAFFEITADASKPFVIDAGNASVRVVGTTFNVITSNSNREVEVFVTSGKVMLSDNSGERSLMLDPGSIGRMGPAAAEKSSNGNPNYMAWKTGHLEYSGQKLSVVFSDLKRAYNMDIVADDPSIADLTWTTAPIDNQPEETIINLICISFNLDYVRDGEVYHLKNK